MVQQMESFKALWPTITPGGIYVIEDLHTSYLEDFGGGRPGISGTTIDYIKSMIDLLYCNIGSVKSALASLCKQHGGSVPNLLDIECYAHACVFIKARANSGSNPA